MKARIWTLGALCVGLVAAAAIGSTRSEAAASCSSGMTTFAGVSARVFCGSATATVHDGSKTFTIKGGNCERTPKALAVNIGEVVLGTVNKAKPDYFGLALSAGAGKDGTYHSAVVGVVHAGKGYPLRGNATAILKSGRTRGSFTASTIFGKTVSGSFAC
jgi:hypothetical protein